LFASLQSTVPRRFRFKRALRFKRVLRFMPWATSAAVMHGSGLRLALQLVGMMDEIDLRRKRRSDAA
jgi:hypothetical protein